MSVWTWKKPMQSMALFTCLMFTLQVSAVYNGISKSILTNCQIMASWYRSIEICGVKEERLMLSSDGVCQV